MRRPVVYLSTPMTNGGTLQICQQRDNVHFATEWAFHLRRRGYSVISPASTFLEEMTIRQHIPHADWIAHDLPLIAVCDALYRLPGESAGADAEVAHADQCQVRVFRDEPTMTAHFRSLGMLP